MQGDSKVRQLHPVGASHRSLKYHEYRSIKARWMRKEAVADRTAAGSARESRSGVRYIKVMSGYENRGMGREV